ncbi:hypothetical protein, partial [Pectobacterium odoriferum]|uniref:hypothetical protein n=1 Tax=Pectobacterium odoriferum TaxID=78398 RepID=UPI0011AFB334
AMLPWYGVASNRLIRDPANEALQQKISRLANLPPASPLRGELAKTGYDQLKAWLMMARPDKAGARNVDSLLNQHILPVLSQQLLTYMAAKQKPQTLCLSWSEEAGIGLEFDRIQGVNA